MSSSHSYSICLAALILWQFRYSKRRDAINSTPPIFSTGREQRKSVVQFLFEVEDRIRGASCFRDADSSLTGKIPLSNNGVVKGTSERTSREETSSEANATSRCSRPRETDAP